MFRTTRTTQPKTVEGHQTRFFKVERRKVRSETVPVKGGGPVWGNRNGSVYPSVRGTYVKRGPDRKSVLSDMMILHVQLRLTHMYKDTSSRTESTGHLSVIRHIIYIFIQPSRSRRSHIQDTSVLKINHY